MAFVDLIEASKWMGIEPLALFTLIQRGEIIAESMKPVCIDESEVIRYMTEVQLRWEN